jgi:hypothetical protein
MSLHCKVLIGLPKQNVSGILNPILTHHRIQGGDNMERPESFHPLYITDDRDGGYGLKDHMERKLETTFAGIDFFSGGMSKPTAIGPLCELVSSEGADKAAESDTFEVSNFEI